MKRKIVARWNGERWVPMRTVEVRPKAAPRGGKVLPFVGNLGAFINDLDGLARQQSLAKQHLHAMQAQAQIPLDGMLSAGLGYQFGQRLF